ncbi:hypothetical protein OHC33_005746 [Knufia fluminis]|uniref:Major facilitator superfamily (MFS) profile domain-containing protein n=1 Tax=Knufia fluminis TaxID=191047 RepID=A0AAN8EDW0_9EURO|nr:hypothetical protein OHC33_005746 [Knufia fluminis]
MAEKDAEPSQTRRDPDALTNDTGQAISVEPPVETAIDAEAATSPSSSTEEKAADEPDPPPNGGLLAWMQVLGSFFLFFNCWGTINSFGAFQTYYENNPYWSENPSNISWIGSIQAFLLLMVGVIAGPVYDMGYFRTLVVTGSFLVPFGFMMTSLCREYWQVVIAQGVVVGLGNGCLWVPSVAILPQYFTTRKALANGLAAAGSSVGGIVYPITFRQLEQSIGFGWATRVIGFISLGTLMISISVMKQRVMPKQKRKLWDLDAFKEPPYSLYCFAMFLAFASFYGPVYYIQPYAIQTGITNESFAFYLLPILNAVSVPGRILPNFAGDYIGALNVLIPASFMTGVMALVWISVHTFDGIIAFACFYGFFSGAFVSIAPVAVVALTPDLRKIGTRMGQSFFICSFGLLIGTPVTGAILSSTGKWIGPQLFSGILLIATSSAFLATRYYQVGLKLMVKA